MKSPQLRRKGFTLIELLVVISIIAILALGVLTVLYNARKESRDLARISDIQQLKLAVKLYKEANGIYPNLNGAAIGIGGSIDTVLQPFLPKINRDPLSAGLSTGYVYLYYNNFTCTNTGQVVVVARQVENRAKYSNYIAACTNSSAPTSYKNLSYIEIVKQ